MNYGLQLSASGVLTNLYRMDVFSNNLANVETVGFKPDIPVLRQREAARQEDGLGMWPSNRLMERLGGGVLLSSNRTKFEQGALTSTGNPLDLAIEGEGFLVFRDLSDESGERFRLSRDGRCARDARGRLVSASSGSPLMDEGNREIVISGDGPVVVDADGTVRQDGRTLARVQLVEVPQRERLVKLGNGLFQAPSDLMENRRPARGVLRQFTTEGSAVDAVAAMMAISEAARAAESNMQMVQSHDRLMDRAINGLGRVGG
jgi:flagellar basal-body rod protein FlgF